MCRTFFTRLAVALSLASFPFAARADECTPLSSGPDAIVGEIPDVIRWGSVGGISGYTIGHQICNIGDAPLPWTISFQHPVFAPNLYRLKNNRFEQIGMGWVKHAVTTGTGSACCACTPPGGNSHLGVGCSDVYDAAYNGQQSLFGPRSEVNPYSGTFQDPWGTQGQSGDAIFKRVQVHISDLDPAVNPGALYFAEVQVVSPDEAAMGNGSNSSSYRKIRVTNFNNGAWGLVPDGPIRRRQPAIFAWQEFDPTVVITAFDILNDGRLYVAHKTQDNGDGTWHYEYAVFNLNSHRSARSFAVPVPQGVTVTNIGFHDIAYHSGEPYDGTDWLGVHENGAVTWSTQTFDENPNANALRWGTLYNFRFDASSSGSIATASIGLFRPGSPNTMGVEVRAPVVVVPLLSAWSLLLMCAALIAAGLVILRVNTKVVA